MTASTATPAPAAAPAAPSAAADSAAPAATPTIGAPAGSPDTAAAPAAPSSIREAARAKFAEMREKVAQEDAGTAPPAAKAPAAKDAAAGDTDTDDDARDDDAAAGAGTDDNADDAADAAGDEAKTGEAPAAAEPRLVASPRFALVDANGEPQAVAWPEGITLELRARGERGKGLERHTVKSFDELATLAVDGLEQRKLASRQGRELTELKTRHTSDVEKIVTENEELLLGILFDEDFRERVAKELEPFRNPEVRKLAAESRKSKANDADRAERAETAAAERTAQLWEIADERFLQLMPEYPLLTADDALVIKQRIHSKYLALREQLASEDAAIRGAFNDAALQEAMQHLNASLESRLGKHRAVAPTGAKPAARPAAKPAAPADPIATADEHNATVDKKLAQANGSRTMRGAGAPPVGGEPVAKAPATWDEGREARKKLFAQAAASP
jgi:hypothetical protein